MTGDSDRTSGWAIRYPDDRTEKRITKTLQRNPDLRPHWGKFKKEVTANPFGPSDSGSITRLKGDTWEDTDTYRFKSGNLRATYHPDTSTTTVYPLEVARADDPLYKKKSSKGKKIP